MRTKVRNSHLQAARAQPNWPPETPVEFISNLNPWRPDADGHRFGNACLSVRPRTVGEVQALKKLFNPPLKYREGHLKWWYTWGDFIKIGGKFYREA